MGMTRTQVYLTPEQHTQLQRMAQAQRSSMAELIRQAVTEFLAQWTTQENPWWSIVGLGASGIADGSVEHDRDIYD